MPNLWRVSNEVTGPGIVPQSAMHAGPGDTILLRRRETFAPLDSAIPARLNGLTIDVWGDGDDLATIDAPEAMTILLASGNWIIRNLRLTDSTRNPTTPGFTPHSGMKNLALLQCQNAAITLENVEMSWGAIGLDVEASAPGQKNLIVRNCLIGPTYGIGERSQGAFTSSVSGAIFDGCFFDTCGWYPGIPGAEANNNQNHGIYSHDTKDGTSGPYIATGCTFWRCCSGGPTADTGADIKQCAIIDCAQDGSWIVGWTGGPRGELANNIVVGGILNFLSRVGNVTGNVRLFRPGESQAFFINIDIPAKQPNPRSPTDAISASGNRLLGGVLSGPRAMPSTLVHVTQFMPSQLTTQDNLAVADDRLAAILWDRVNSSLARKRGIGA